MYINFDCATVSKVECEALIAFLQVMKKGAADEVIRHSNNSNTIAAAPAPAPVQFVPEPDPIIDLSGDEPVEAEEPEVESGDTSEYDKAGFPWDERIHSSSKAVNKDGTWKLKRGVDKELVKQIQDEFTGVTEEPEQPATTTPPANQVGFQQQQQPEQPAQPEGGQVTWVNVLQRISAANTTQEQVNEGLKHVGIEGAFPLLAGRPDLFEAFLAKVGA